jgi:phosphate/sulfate permease
METFYFLLVVFILCLAVFDLMVGVSNDAVNFINSSVGSKAAPLKVILLVAGLGVVIGASLSNGMIDIARNGIFNPDKFVFADVMYIFVAAMITDVFLLDFFNTLGLPTSTTVSFVFELLGASFAISMLMIFNDPTDSLQFVQLLNTEKALAIISGIFLSVAIAFICGSIIQFFVRLIFTLNFKKNLKYFAAVYGGLAVTAIVYFMLIKGVRNSSFISPSQMTEISRLTPMILLGSFVFFTILMEILYLLKVNVLKVVVLFGTFALALAFASNDLVNFIGVPLAGLESYLHYIASGGGNIAKTLTMETLNGPSQTPFYFLLIAAIIMLIALLTSKKAHNVVKTEINLAKQDESEDIFNSSVLGRNLVRGVHKMSKSVDKTIPDKVKLWISKRFDKSDLTLEDGASFDLLRASVNLIVAGVLIALGTSLKLPLSTTYVTFIVAMGSSLADRAWGRDNAVYRISGVLNVIGGWFITAIAAFMLTFVVAILIYYGGPFAIIPLIVLVVFMLIRNQKMFKRREKRHVERDTVVKLMKHGNADTALELLQNHVREDIRKCQRSKIERKCRY